jgi:hypothetical protein
LLIGYIARPGRDATGEWNIDFASWIALCREAARHWTGQTKNTMLDDRATSSDPAPAPAGVAMRGIGSDHDPPSSTGGLSWLGS